MIPKILIYFLAVSFVGSGLYAENWPQYRGPTGQGHSSETGIPTRWTATDQVVWKTEIPGAGWSSPVVWGDRVFVTSVQENETSCRVICVNRRSGKILWNREAFVQVPRRKERKNSYATPTPVVDGRRVYVTFGNGGMAAFSMDGVMQWKNLEVEFYSRHGLGSSPILYQGRVIMAFDGSFPVDQAGDWPNNSPQEKVGWQVPWDQAFLVALDAESGKRIWKAKRGMSRIAHITPNILSLPDGDQLISTAGDVIQGYDPLTGRLRWNVYSQGEGVTPGFAMGDGMIFTASGFEKSTIRVVRPGGEGDLTETGIVWEQRKGVPNQCSLLYVSPYLYSVTDGGIVNCFDGKTGEIIYQERVGGNHCSSPLYVDGRIYVLSEEGETTVLQAGPEFKILERNSIGERCQASLAVSQGNLFLRSEKHLYCIGEDVKD